jgi:preprotein translocase subunit YajC
MANDWKVGDRFLLRSGRAVGTVIGVSQDRIKIQYDNGNVEEVNPIDILHNVKPEPDPDEEDE